MNTNRKRVLFTGGRAPVTLDFIRKFAIDGHTVFVADSIPIYIAKKSRYVEHAFVVEKPARNFKQFLDDLERIVIENQIDLIIPTCEEIFWIAMGKEVLEKNCHVFCESIDVLRTLHHKGEFINTVKEKGLAVPETFTVASTDQLEEARSKLVNFVVKPAYSRFSSKILFSRENEVEINRLKPSDKHPYVIQQYIKGRQFCSYAVVIKGKIEALSIYEANMTAGRGATIVFQHTDHEQISNWMRGFFKNSTLTGQFAFDLMIDKDGAVLPLECNPRATSGAHLFDNELASVFLGESYEVKPIKAKKMLLLAVLGYGWKGQHIKHFFKTLVTSSDVIFSIKDIIPSIYQLLVYIHLVFVATTLRITTIEASTVDIEWNGG